QFFHESGSRLDVARHVIADRMMPALNKNQLSIVAFQGKANMLVPLTDSYDVILKVLDPKNKQGLRIGSAPFGDAIVDGKVSSIAAFLEVALDEFKEDGAQDHEKVIVLFSNGDDISDGAWLAEEIEKLKEAHVKVVIFGLG